MQKLPKHSFSDSDSSFQVTQDEQMNYFDLTVINFVIPATSSPSFFPNQVIAIAFPFVNIFGVYYQGTKGVCGLKVESK